MALMKKPRYGCAGCGCDLEKQEGFEPGRMTLWSCKKCSYVNQVKLIEETPAEAEAEAARIPVFKKIKKKDKTETSDTEGAAKTSAKPEETEEVPEETRDAVSETAAGSEEKDSLLGLLWNHYFGSSSQLDAKKLIFLLMAVLLLLLLLFVSNWQDQKKKPIKHAYTYYLGKSKEEVISELSGLDFTNITAIAIRDLPLDYADYENTVAEVKIGRNNTFCETDTFPYDKEITITYHAMIEIPIPFSSADLRKLTYESALQKFMDAGFVNITGRSEEGMWTGILDNGGTIKEVLINGNSRFKVGDLFAPDTEVTIVYHAYGN